MTLKEANKEIEKLDNEYEYWLSQKELAKKIVYPKAIDIRAEKVDGGNREDRLLKYVELLDDKKIDETLDYIFKRKQNLMNWIDEELKIMGKYGELEKLIVYYKEQSIEKFSWLQISQKVHYSISHCKRIYKIYKNKRFFENDTM